MSNLHVNTFRHLLCPLFADSESSEFLMQSMKTYEIFKALKGKDIDTISDISRRLVAAFYNLKKPLYNKMKLLIFLGYNI